MQTRTALLPSTTLVFLLFAGSSPLAAQEKGDELLQLHVREQSSAWFAAHTGGSPFQKVDAREADRKLLQKIANRISRAAGYGDYENTILVVQNPADPKMVNAATYPGGQILFLQHALDLARQRAEQMARERKGSSADVHYENLLAAIMGHELGHYYGRHYMRKYATMINSMRDGGRVKEMKQIAYSQSYELEADQFSYVMLGKAGYDPEYMIHALQLLKSVSGGTNPYLNSHPGMNDRLARLSSGERGAEFARLAELEAAFAAVETGGKDRLKKAVKVLERELKSTPDNPFLISTTAKAYHRLWEESCDISELLFKASILHTPFRDEMLHKQGARTRGARRIPGNQFYYKQARSYYERALPMTDILTVSAFSALAAYDPATQKGAVQMAMEVLKRGKKLPQLIQTVFLNNAGIALYMSGDHENAGRAFAAAAGNLDNGIKEMAAKSPAATGQFLKHQQVLQSASSRNTGQLIEAFFNLGQFFHLQGRKDLSKQLWTRYVTYLDPVSDWSRYAADEIDLKVEPPESLAVKGVKAGMGIPDLVKRWGAPDSRGIDKTKLDRWVYGERGAQVYLGAGFVTSIVLGGERAPKVAGIGVGTPKDELEERLGKPAARRGPMALYPRQRLVVVYDVLGKVDQIILQ